MAHDHEISHEHDRMHKCFKITKLALKVLGVAAAFGIMEEIHRLHKVIESQGRRK